MPTIAEAGVAGYEFETWNGILAPRGTPAAITTLLNDRIRKTLANPDIAQKLQGDGLEVATSSPDEFASHLKHELEKWGPVLKARSMRAE